jgi:hypothetical protein
MVAQTIAGAEVLQFQQKAAAKVKDRMVGTMINYQPCGKLTVDDIKYLAEMAGGFAFDAMQDVA